MQFDEPDFRGGANKESLNEARANYKKFGACSEEFAHLVRPPTVEENRG